MESLAHERFSHFVLFETPSDRMFPPESNINSSNNAGKVVFVMTDYRLINIRRTRNVSVYVKVAS